MYSVDEKSNIDRILDEVGDEVSRKILKSLSSAPKTAAEISLETGIPAPTVYRKVVQLRTAGLVSTSSFIIQGGKKEAIQYCTINQIHWTLQSGNDSLKLRSSKVGVDFLWMRLFSKI